MKSRKGCKLCGAGPGEQHLIGCPAEENSYVDVPPIEEVEATFIELNLEA